MVASETTQEQLEQEQVTVRAREYNILAVDVSAEDYMEKFAEHHREWVNGTVYAMSPIHIRHNLLVRYLSNLLDVYFELNPIGTFQNDPFVMKIETEESTTRRQPDLQIILGDNVKNLKETFMDGVADICVEVVSDGSTRVDLGDKFVEYEAAGVKEYWIIDPTRDQTHFYRLNDDGHYKQQVVDAIYQTNLLPKLQLSIKTLWHDPLPKPTAIVKAVQDMMEQ